VSQKENELIFAPLPRDFYRAPTLMVARSLLGKTLVRRFEDETIAAGRIVETEAYTRDDPACHAFRGMSRANAAMFGPPGHAYVHINYGIYYCLNAVTAEEGCPEAALIRAIEPIQNAARMYRNYFGAEVDEETARREKRLGAGPGRLAIALAIDKAYDRTDLTNAASPIFLAGGADVPEEEVVITTRIGITKAADYPWRFYVRASRYISKRIREGK
jgi:DNA-3-methyladenine glycosylase